MQNLRALRKRLRLTQEALAHAADTTTPTISRIESGKLWPSKPLLGRIAAALHVRPSEIIQDTLTDTGLAEGRVEAWTPEAAETGSNRLILQPEMLAPGAKHPAFFRMMGSGAVAFCLPPGAILVIDLGRPPVEGEIVVVGMTDMDTSETRTMVARLSGEHLFGSNFMLDPTDRWPVADDGVAIYGPVVASLIRMDGFS